MFGGEIHYGRVQPRYWGAILDAAKDLGIDVIGCYVMWDLHEVREGVHDFAALHAFLAEVKTRGFRVLARPGPFFYAEWRNLGIPDHAVPYHKFHPEFRRKASLWIGAVMRELAPYLGRSIVAVQADNEIDPMLHIYGEGLVEADPLPFLVPFADTPAFRASCEARYDLATRYARWVVGEYRKNGCTVPILLNTWPGVDAQNWRDLAEISDLFGIDPYPTNECRTDYRYFRERLRLLRAVTRFPYLAEFGSGTWRGMDVVYSPEHVRLTALTALAAGVRGWNWYMLANRDNWVGAPINERGVIDPKLGSVYRDAIRSARELEGAPPPETSVAVTWSWRYHQIAQIRRAEADDPLFAVLHDMGIEYDFADVDRDFPPPRLLFWAGDIEDPSRVWRYVEEGGTLVMFQRGTVPDGTSHPASEHLAVSLGFTTQKPVFAYRTVPGEPITARQLPWPVDEDGRRMMELAVGRTYTCGYIEKRGRGTLVVLGCAPSREAVLAVHRHLGIEVPVLPLTPGVHASKRGDRIVVLNPGEARTARLRTEDGERIVDLPRCGGIIL